jgi:hypothetical protein
MSKRLMLLAGTVVLGACTGVPERAPTHRWEGQPSISHSEYRRDCMTAAGYTLVGL